MFDTLCVMLFMIRMLARIVGALFLLLGIAGFFTNGFVYDMRVTVELNFLHIIIGILGIASARVYTYAKHWLVLFGIGIFALGMYSLFADNSQSSLVTNNIGSSFYLLVGGLMVLIPTIWKPKNV